MKKRLLCLLMGCMFIVTAALTGCSGKGNAVDTNETGEVPDNQEEVDRSPMTLSLWLPTSKDTTDEAIKQVEEAISKITQLKFQTKIELHAISEDKYQDAIDNKIDDIAEVQKKAERDAQSLKEKEKELAKQGIAIEKESDSESESVETDVETYVDDNGQSVALYPEVKDDQLDIFLIKGYDNYKKYIDDNAIQSLDGEISGNSKLLRTYIYPTFLSCANQTGVYAIPNNHAIGEYQFLLINKELVDRYDYVADDLQTLNDCEGFITDIGSMNLDGVVPLLGECEVGNMVYFSSDGNWSLLGDRIIKDYEHTTKTEIGSTLDLSGFTSTISMMKHLKELGYVGNGSVSGNQKFAVGVVKGDASIKEQYEDDYYVRIHAVPYADEDDVFESMFAVSNYSKDLARSMEVITYLNTNKELRTVLQYGVEGVHWELDSRDNEEEVIKILSDDYKMNLVDTGNVFMTYPGEGVSMDYWKAAKQQNLDSATSPYIGFEDYVTQTNSSYFKTLAQFSAQIKNQIDAMSYEEFQSNISSIKRSVLTNKAFASLVLKEASDDIEEPLGMLYDMYASAK